MKLHTFIFNWRGQYNKTKEKEQQLKALNIPYTVINSDEEHEEDGWENIGEDSYFTAQFLKAIEVFSQTDADVFFHIQADASFDNWGGLIYDAEKYFEEYNWGIYAPNVDYTWYDSEKVDLNALELEYPNLKMVSNTDCTCWFIHRDIIQMAHDRGVDFSPYKMGWSFDIVYTALAYMNQRPVLRDYNYTIDHPKGTNYNTQQAEKEMQDLFFSLPNDIQIAFASIKGDKNNLYNYYK